MRISNGTQRRRKEPNKQVNETGIWIAVAATMAGCFFAACNGALAVFSRTKLSEQLESTRRAKYLEAFYRQVPELQLMTGTLRILASMAVLLSVLATVQNRIPEAWDVMWTYLLTVAIAGLVVTVFFVAVAGSWARYSPEKLLGFSMPLLNGCLILFVPLVRFLRVFDPVVRRLAGAENNKDENDLSDQIMSVVEEHDDEGVVDVAQKELIEAVIEFPTTTAGEIMTPRTEVEGVEVSSDLGNIKEVILRDGHSRIPVYEDTVDHIVGILYVKDLTTYLGQSENDFDLKSLMRKPMMVPGTKSVRQLLAEFKFNKVHIAIVLDEYGGTAGLVTIEDIIEELVGEIEDEYEQEEERPGIRREDDTSAEIDARVEIDEANDRLGLNLPDDEEYETVGGFVFSALGHIPEVGESVELNNARLIVTEAEQNRIKRLRVEFTVPATPESDDNGRNGQ